MTPREKAAELYTTFQQYIWDETNLLPDHNQTIATVQLVIDEIEKQADNWGVVSVQGYWKQVRIELNTI